MLSTHTKLELLKNVLSSFINSSSKFNVGYTNLLSFSQVNFLFFEGSKISNFINFVYLLYYPLNFINKKKIL
jgi:hypothetical protein